MNEYKGECEQKTAEKSPPAGKWSLWWQNYIEFRVQEIVSQGFGLNSNNYVPDDKSRTTLRINKWIIG